MPKSTDRDDTYDGPSLIDALVEGAFDDLPDGVQERLRAVANHRFFPTVAAQWAAAADVLREHRDA